MIGKSRRQKQGLQQAVMHCQWERSVTWRRLRKN
jgi:hypothetical protein